MLDIAWPLLPVAWGAIGWLLAIPLNAFIYELPRDSQISLNPKCEACSARIALFGLPGPHRCVCGQPLGYDRTEWLLAPLFVLLTVWFGPTGPLLLYSLYTAMLLVVGVIDFRRRYVYHITTLPPLVLALVLTPLLTGVHFLFAGAGALVGAGIFGGLYLIGRLIWRHEEPIGMGDIQIAALIGAMDAFPRVVGALFLASLINAGFSLALLARGRGLRHYIPYGSGMCLATFITFFFPP